MDNNRLTKPFAKIKDRPVPNNTDAKLAIDLGKVTHLRARAVKPLMARMAGWASCRMILRNAVPAAKMAEGFPGNGQVIDPALGLRPGHNVIQAACLLKTVSEVLILMHSSSQIMVLGPNWASCCGFALAGTDC